MTDPWFKSLTDLGLRPYVATARHQLRGLNLGVLGPDHELYLLEDPQATSFHQAYVTANALAFGARDLKMPGWVYIDCVLMQTAVVGFAARKIDAPQSLLDEFQAEASIDLDALEWVPVSGQIASPAMDGSTLVGFSLFSLRSYWPKLPALGLATKALALQVYKADQRKRFLGITQYDNPALSMHGRFGPRLEIVSPRVPLHAQGDNTLVYGMKIDFDPATMGNEPASSIDPDFWLQSGDKDAVAKLEIGIAAGSRYFILPPFQVRDGTSFKLPILEEKNS